jgi:hypothetical protein
MAEAEPPAQQPAKKRRASGTQYSWKDNPGAGELVQAHLRQHGPWNGYGPHLAALINLRFPPAAGRQAVTQGAVTGRVARGKYNQEGSGVTYPPKPEGARRWRKPAAEQLAAELGGAGLGAAAGEGADEEVPQVSGSAEEVPQVSRSAAEAPAMTKPARKICTEVARGTRREMRQVVADYVQGVVDSGGDLTYNSDGLKASTGYGSLLQGLDNTADAVVHEQKFAEIHHYAILKARGGKPADTEASREMRELWESVKAGNASSSEDMWKLTEQLYQTDVFSALEKPGSANPGVNAAFPPENSRGEACSSAYPVALAWMDTEEGPEDGMELGLHGSAGDDVQLSARSSALPPPHPSHLPPPLMLSASTANAVASTPHDVHPAKKRKGADQSTVATMHSEVDTENSEVEPRSTVKLKHIPANVRAGLSRKNCNQGMALSKPLFIPRGARAQGPRPGLRCVRPPHVAATTVLPSG